MFILYASIWSAQGLGEFTRAIGLEQDLSDRGYGIRSKRYVMLIDNGTVTEIHVEPPGDYGVSSAEALLARLNSEAARLQDVRA